MLLFFKNLLFLVVVPGTVTIWFPRWLLARRGVGLPSDWGVVEALALAPIAAGAAVLLWCIWDFAVAGRGTPAPIDPPRALVVRGLYRRVRNPMYLGVITVLLGEALLFRSRDLLLWAATFFLVVHLAVVLYEEPVLRRKFGTAYDEYRRTAGRWIPRLR